MSGRNQYQAFVILICFLYPKSLVNWETRSLLYYIRYINHSYCTPIYNIHVYGRDLKMRLHLWYKLRFSFKNIKLQCSHVPKHLLVLRLDSWLVQLKYKRCQHYSIQLPSHFLRALYPPQKWWTVISTEPMISCCSQWTATAFGPNSIPISTHHSQNVNRVEKEAKSFIFFPFIEPIHNIHEIEFFPPLDLFPQLARFRK